MRRLAVLVLCAVGWSCTMANPAFEGGDEFADDTRGTFEDSDPTKPDSESGSSSAEADSESDGLPTSSSVDGDGDGDPSAGDGDGDTNSGSSSTDGSTSSSTDDGSTGSSTDDGSTSTTEGSTSTTTEEGSSSSDFVEMCMLVDPADPCLNCAEGLCCNAGPPNCFDPDQPCGCVLKCLLGNDNQCLIQCGMVDPLDTQDANAVNDCLGADCDGFCL